MIAAGGLAGHYPVDAVIACGGLLGVAATLLVTGKGGARSGGRAAVQFARAGCGKLGHG